MNLVDFAIIYLACGAPFGVYYFLSEKHHVRERWFIAKLSASILFWFFFAARLFANNERLRYFFDSDQDKKVVSEFQTLRALDEVRRDCEAALVATNTDFRVYEFREAFDRYVGLSLELNSSGDAPTDALVGVGEISGYGKSIHNARCLHRRNLERLRFHRECARRSIAEILRPALAASGQQELQNSSLSRLTRILNDGVLSGSLPATGSSAVPHVSSGHDRPDLSDTADNFVLDRAA